jgi:hypothetical protein
MGDFLIGAGRDGGFAKLSGERGGGNEKIGGRMRVRGARGFSRYLDF